MLVPLSVQLARSKRKKHALLSCRVTSFEVAAAAVRAAETHDQPLIITLDLPYVTTVHASTMIEILLNVARQASVEISVEVLVEPLQRAVELALDAGALAITPISHGISDEQLAALVAWAHKRTVAYGSEVVLHLGRPAVSQLIIDRIENSQVNVARITVQSDKKLIAAHELKDIVKHTKIPLIADEAPLSKVQIERVLQTGVAAITIGAQLGEAYTAGLRTGLRNRSHTQPFHYAKPASLAVEGTLSTYFTYVNS